MRFKVHRPPQIGDTIYSREEKHYYEVLDFHLETSTYKIYSCSTVGRYRYVTGLQILREYELVNGKTVKVLHGI